jgi:hypothetical protein
MFRQKSILYIISVLLILFVTSCGLYYITTLNPPQFVSFSDADNYFIFRTVGDHDDYLDDISFRGFELYYKIYLQGSTVDSNLLSLSELTSNGFKRIADSDDRINNISKPLIPIEHLPAAFPLETNRDDTFDITVDFDGLEEAIPSEPFAAADDPTLLPPVSFSIELRREGIPDNRIGHEDEFKPFSVFEEGDADISNDIWNAISGGSAVTIALYALSYGKQDLIIDVYSIAVYLFEIDIELPYEE